MQDIGKSVLDKLRAKAKATSTPYQQCLQLFFQEEFLRRLSRSRFSSNLILKGGLFIYTLTDFQSRATVDVDFLLHQQPSTPEEVQAMIEEILQAQTGNDFIQMTAKGFQEISAQRKYKGISAQIIGQIKNVRVPFDVDMGVGDVIVPKAERRAIQTQLPGYEAPEILVYSLESTIAEKFDAILQRFELNGRMKDFYDIYYLSRTFDFDGELLQKAIKASLQNRGTEHGRDSFEEIKRLPEHPDMQTRWSHFLKKLEKPSIDFALVVEELAVFLEPVYIAMVDKKSYCSRWNCGERTWK